MVWGSLHSSKAIIDVRDAKIFIYNRLWEDYLVWKKYQDLFPIKNYILRVFKSPYSDTHHSFLFINKKNCLKKIQDNIHLFKEKLGDFTTPNNILHLLETKNNIIDEVFKGNEDLLGILLGFGKHNAQEYQRREEIEKRFPPPFDGDKIKEIYHINLTGFPDDDQDKLLLNFIRLPYFVEDKDHPESIQLRQKYRNMQKILCEIYSQGNFLEPTLKALTKKDKK